MLLYKFIYSVSFADSGPSFTNGVTFHADSPYKAYVFAKRFLINFCDFVQGLYEDLDLMVPYFSLEAVNNDV